MKVCDGLRLLRTRLLRRDQRCTEAAAYAVLTELNRRLPDTLLAVLISAAPERWSVVLAEHPEPLLTGPDRFSFAGAVRVRLPKPLRRRSSAVITSVMLELAETLQPELLQSFACALPLQVRLFLPVSCWGAPADFEMVKE